MFDDDSIFDIHDEIVFTKSKIILEKKTCNFSEDELIKQLKELDGNWEYNICSDNDILENDDWISKNQTKLIHVYQDLMSRSFYNDIFCKLSCADLCDYLNISRKQKQDITWSSFTSYKFYGLKKPTVNEWSMHHATELHFLYNLCFQEYGIRFGDPHRFVEFAFKNSFTQKISYF